MPSKMMEMHKKVLDVLNQREKLCVNIYMEENFLKFFFLED